MADPATLVDLPDDLRAFAEERVRTGKNASVAEVVRVALEEEKRASLQEAIDEGLADLAGGDGVDATPEELMAEVRREAGLGT